MGTVHAKETTSFTHSEMDDGVVKEPKTINLHEVQARVDKVNVEGLIRTKDDIVKRSIKDLFGVKNFEEVIKEAHRVRGKLESLGCFHSIAIHIDTSSGPKATPNGYEITYIVRELKRMKGSVNTVVGRDNEGSLVVGAVAPNIFGRAEKLHTEFSYGSRRTRTLNIGFYKPFLLDTNAELNSSIFQNELEWPSSGYKQLDRGTILDIGFFSLPKIKHNIQWEGCWRELSVGNRYTSFTVREASGHTLKSSLKHILSVDLRDSGLLPYSGSLVQCTTELAGIGGNVNFIKNELLLQQNVEIFPDTVVQGTLSGGIMKPTGGDQQEVCICDRFFLGGPHSLRGFTSRGIGPQNDGSFLGGTLYWAGALHLYAPLPFRPGAGGFGDMFRTHIFANAGNVGSYDSGKENWLQEMRDGTRMAYGVGLALRLGQMARIELNYVIPVYFQETDSINKGVQFGIGVHFL